MILENSIYENSPKFIKTERAGIIGMMLKEHRFYYVITDTFDQCRFGHGSVLLVPISCVWACLDAGIEVFVNKGLFNKTFRKTVELGFSFSSADIAFLTSWIHWVLKFIGRRKRRRQTSSSCKYQVSNCLSCKFILVTALFKKNKRILKFKDMLELLDLWLVDFDPFCVFLCVRVLFFWS